MKVSFTLVLVLADVSMNKHPHFSAVARPSSSLTALSFSKSFLLPTKIIGN